MYEIYGITENILRSMPQEYDNKAMKLLVFCFVLGAPNKMHAFYVNATPSMMKNVLEYMYRAAVCIQRASTIKNGMKLIHRARTPLTDDERAAMEAQARRAVVGEDDDAATVGA